MPSLNILDLGSNQLTWDDPVQPGQPREPVDPRSSSNELTGSIPTAWAASRMYRLNLSRNHLTGVVPSALGGVSRLQNLNLASNAYRAPCLPR